MKILAIETSCDETAVGLLECRGDTEHPQCDVLAHTLYSQIAEHREYGGVYPNLAKRLHSQNLVPLLKEVLKEAGQLNQTKENQNHSNVRANIGMILEREPELFEQFSEFAPTIEKPSIDAIAVTQGPGLEPALWVGLNFARSLSLFWDIPLIPVNHMEGHIASVLYKDQTPVAFPALALLVSGGHTQLVLAKNWGDYKLLGETRDDAVGEAFDKVARILDLPYPGGPEISKLAQQARKENAEPTVELPRPMLYTNDYDFSFSGLKTAVLYAERDKSTTALELALEFEHAVTDVLITKTKKALEEYKPKTLIVAGGVIANTHLRKAFQKLAPDILRIPDKDVTGDNAIMIGIAGFLQQHHVENRAELSAQGNLQLQTR